MRSWRAVPVSSIPRSAEQSMGGAREAVARIGEGPDVVTGEDAPAASAPAGRTSAGWKVLPIVEGLVLLIALVLPWILQDYLTVFATRVVILALFALSFDLVWGYAGIMSFGQALFFGAAGYGVALMARDLNVTSILLILPAGTLIGLTAALLLGGFLLLGRYPSSVIFVSLGTLTGSYAADRLARGWYYLGGQNGIPSIPPLTLGSYEFEEGPVYYYMVLGILVVTYLLCRFLVRSQFGLALAGLRENEQRIAFFGYKAQHLKAIIFAVGGTIAGLAGSLYAFHEGFVWPNMLGVVFSTQVVLYVLFGGSGTLIGAVIGTVIIEGVSFWLSDNYRDVWPIILGVLLLLVIMFRPLGLVSFVLGERERVGSFGKEPGKGPSKAPKKEVGNAAP
ncbi:branched-chain amino acid ABC transporter permease [Bradyrhizobium sp. UFLA 03-164]|uniref:Branched-chain amino acid ABC transporter permease n=2 Tax=Bradyrhizobium uaiense TaxID=2594946 RepID=A0A6P1BUJ0_9BRAD|nr:branched-chain amino acid ABC transporter permease [Bradyrhizobium uaiense]